MPSLEDKILGQAFIGANVTLASGVNANNIYEMKRLASNPELFKEVVKNLAKLVFEFNPDLVMYVPNGGKIFAEPVAKELGVVIAHLWKSPEFPDLGLSKRMYISKPSDARAIAQAERAVLIEDVVTTLRSTKEALALDGVTGTVIGMVSILIRGNDEDLNSLDLPKKALVKRYLPSIMSAEELQHYQTLSAEVYQAETP